MTHDAIVVGAGPNGLVAANLLADAGWSVLVLEAEPTVGGAVRSDRDVHRDYVHDTFSSFYPLAEAAGIFAGLRLEEHGLRWCHAPAVLGHPLPDGGWALLDRDRDRTAGWFDAVHPGDGERWLRLCDTWDRIGSGLVSALTSPFPPLRAGARLGWQLPRAGGLDLVRHLLAPAAEIADGFGGPGPGLVTAGNAAHADLPLHAPGSGAFGLLMTMLGQTVGFPVPQGGAGTLSAALEHRLAARGAEVRCGVRVAHVQVTDGAVRGVVTGAGECLAAPVVVAGVSAPALFGRLLSPAAVPTRVARQLDAFVWDPGTVKVDWALDGPVPWSDPPAQAPGTVHLADSVDAMALASAQVSSRHVPAHPFVLAGQMTTSDPTRSPAGTEALWAYAHVPQPGPQVRDAGDGTITGRWDRDDCERFADRIQARIERHAPGFGARVVRRRVLGPHDLEARDANLVGGALNGGTSQLHQELFFRPVPALRGRPETGVRGLYLGSASAHPGGGVHGAPGANAARAALWHARVGRIPLLGRRRR